MSNAMRTPVRGARSGGVADDGALAVTSAEVEWLLDAVPGYSAALRPRPRANVCNPSGILV